MSFQNTRFSKTQTSPNQERLSYATGKETRRKNARESVMRERKEKEKGVVKISRGIKVSERRTTLFTFLFVNNLEHYY